jgi:hypothetical protein
VSACFAKFVLFYEVEIIDEMWKKAKDAIDKKLFSDNAFALSSSITVLPVISDHVIYISCSTALSQQRQISPRILLNVSQSVDISQLEQIGHVIADYMNYQSSSGYLYCKIIETQHICDDIRGTTVSKMKQENSSLGPSKTIRIKCTKCKDTQLFDLQERRDWEIDGYKSNTFQVDYDFFFAKVLDQNGISH